MSLLPKFNITLDRNTRLSRVEIDGVLQKGVVRVGISHSADGEDSPFPTVMLTYYADKVDVSGVGVIANGHITTTPEGLVEP